MNPTPIASDAEKPTRRRIIQASLAGLAMLSRQARASPAAGQMGRDEPVRFAHVTDVHACALERATHGFLSALASIAQLRPAPDFIITGGDHVMDAFSCSPSLAAAQWDIYARTLEGNCRLPAFPVIGNHDVLGCGAPRASYGKAMALDRLNLQRSYYSFDRGGWHFICLDNIAPRNGSYYGALDPQQIEWLRHDLRQPGRETPICVVTHIPLLSACVFFDPGTSRIDGYAVRSSDMHHDVHSLLAILRPEQGPYNVRLLLSGHIHLLDRIEYRGMTFICGGALCGNWWQGAWQGCEPGYGIVDVWPDGRFQHQYVPYADRL